MMFLHKMQSNRQYKEQKTTKTVNASPNIAHQMVKLRKEQAKMVRTLMMILKKESKLMKSTKPEEKISLSKIINSQKSIAKLRIAQLKKKEKMLKKARLKMQADMLQQTKFVRPAGQMKSKQITHNQQVKKFQAR